MRVITAIEIATSAGIEPKTFRAALRKRKFEWHARYERWEVAYGSAEHADMELVLTSLR